MEGDRNQAQDGLSPSESKYCKDCVTLKWPESVTNMEQNRQESKGTNNQAPSDVILTS